MPIVLKFQCICRMQKGNSFMLMSESKMFIFIHIYKNAGKSITASLINDRITKMRYVTNRVSKKLRIPLNIQPQPFDDHVKASEIVDKIGIEEFNRYFSFAFVRNPWDWQVSLYSYALKNKNHHQHEQTKSFLTFDHYIEWRCKNEVRLQSDCIYSESNQLLVDFVGRYENIASDFEIVCKKLKIKTSLQKINVSNTRNFREFYTLDSLEMIREAYEKDIQLLNYEF